MPLLNMRILAYLALPLACFTSPDLARAGVGDMSGEALSSFAHVSLAHTVQAGECWEPDGPDGPGYYPCSDLGWGGPISGPTFGLHHRHRVIVSHPHATNFVYPGAPPGRASASGGVPPAHLRGVGGSAFGVVGVHAPAGFQHGAAPAWRGPAGVHALGSAAIPHIRAPSSAGGAGLAVGAPHFGAPSPGLAGVHAPGSVPIPHISAPASPIRAGGVGGVPHIGAPVSPNFAGVHAPATAAIPRVAAPASPRFAGVHGVGGGVGIGRH